MTTRCSDVQLLSLKLTIVPFVYGQLHAQCRLRPGACGSIVVFVGNPTNLANLFWTVAHHSFIKVCVWLWYFLKDPNTTNFCNETDYIDITMMRVVLYISSPSIFRDYFNRILTSIEHGVGRFVTIWILKLCMGIMQCTYYTLSLK